MNEHVLVRMGVSGRITFVIFALAFVVFALFCVTFTVELRCERVAERDLFCTSHGHSWFHDTEESVEARDVREVKTVMHLHGSGGKRANTMLAVCAIGESEVQVPIPNAALLLPATRREIASELDVFVQGADGTPYVRHITGEPFLLALIASLMLFFPIALRGAIRNTLVAVDRRAGTVTISRRLFRFTTSRTVVPLSRTVTVMGRAKRKGQDLFLQLAQGDPVHIEWVPDRRAVADFAALKRLFPLDRGITAP
jgi:hypothetical protein